MVLPSQVADVRMRIVNSDGSGAEMCGNGIRCFCKHVFDRGLVNKTDFTVETVGGIMHPVIVGENGEAKTNINFAQLIDDHTIRVRTW